MENQTEILEVKPLTDNNQIATWKKAGLVLLVFSEVGLVPLLAEANAQSIDITAKIFNWSPAALADIEFYVGYGLAGPYAIAAMLSVGNINESIKKLLATDGETYEVNCSVKTSQYILIGTSFLIGSAAAAVGVLQKWGHTWPFYILAGYTLTGQMVAVLLQANKRIPASANSMQLFFMHDGKIELLKHSFSKPMLFATINTLCNMTYWGAFYYFVSANINQLFHAPKLAEIISSSISASLGSYMSFCIQGMGELSAAYQKSKPGSPQSNNDTSQFKDANFLSISLITLSFLCRTLAVIGFAYSLMHGETEDQNAFVKSIGIAALALVIPGASSAVQYVKYIHNQVSEGLSSLGSFITCRYSLHGRHAVSDLVNPINADERTPFAPQQK